MPAKGEAAPVDPIKIDAEVAVEKAPATKGEVDTEVAKLDRTDYEAPELEAFVASVEEQYRDRTPQEEADKAEADKAQALRNAVISKAAGDAKYRAGDYDAAKGYYAEEAAFLAQAKGDK